MPLNLKKKEFMTLPLLRYPLDITGTNPDNFVANEDHVLINRPSRALAPTYGAYFSDTLVVVDKATQKTLKRGLDYLCTELIQVATEQTGKEVCYLIIIVNTTISSTVTVSYQAIGGAYTRSADAILSMLDLIHRDDRPVNWPDIVDRPDVFTPAPHLHDIGDAYGFEYIIASLERVRNAILLSDTPAYDRILTWMDNQFDLNKQTNQLQVDTLESHLSNYDNSHRVTKEQIGLGLLTNLPLANDSDITYVLGLPANSLPATITNDRFVSLRSLVVWQNSIYNRILGVESRLHSIDNLNAVLPVAGVAPSAPNTPLPVLNVSTVDQMVYRDAIIPFTAVLTGFTPNTAYTLKTALTGLQVNTQIESIADLVVTTNTTGSVTLVLGGHIFPVAPTGDFTVNISVKSGTGATAAGAPIKLTVLDSTPPVTITWIADYGFNAITLAPGTEVSMLGTASGLAKNVNYTTKTYLRRVGTGSADASQLPPIITTMKSSGLGVINLSKHFVIPDTTQSGGQQTYVEIWTLGIGTPTLVGVSERVTFNIGLPKLKFVWTSWTHDSGVPIERGTVLEFTGSAEGLTSDTYYNIKTYLRRPGTLSNDITQGLPLTVLKQSDINGKIYLNGTVIVPAPAIAGPLNGYTEVWDITNTILLGRTFNIVFNIVTIPVPSLVWEVNSISILSSAIGTLRANITNLLPNTAYVFKSALTPNGTVTFSTLPPATAADVGFITDSLGLATVDINVAGITMTTEATGVIVSPHILPVGSTLSVLDGNVAYVYITQAVVALPRITSWSSSKASIAKGDTFTMTGTVINLLPSTTYTSAAIVNNQNTITLISSGNAVYDTFTTDSTGSAVFTGSVNTALLEHPLNGVQNTDWLNTTQLSILPLIYKAPGTYLTSTVPTLVNITKTPVFVSWLNSLGSASGSLTAGANLTLIAVLKDFAPNTTYYALPKMTNTGVGGAIGTGLTQGFTTDSTGNATVNVNIDYASVMVPNTSDVIISVQCLISPYTGTNPGDTSPTNFTLTVKPVPVILTPVVNTFTVASNNIMSGGNTLSDSNSFVFTTSVSNLTPNIVYATTFTLAPGTESLPSLAAFTTDSTGNATFTSFLLATRDVPTSYSGSVIQKVYANNATLGTSIISTAPLTITTGTNSISNQSTLTAVAGTAISVTPSFTGASSTGIYSLKTFIAPIVNGVTQTGVLRDTTAITGHPFLLSSPISFVSSSTDTGTFAVWSEAWNGSRKEGTTSSITFTMTASAVNTVVGTMSGTPTIATNPNGAATINTTIAVNSTYTGLTPSFNFAVEVFATYYDTNGVSLSVVSDPTYVNTNITPSSAAGIITTTSSFVADPTAAYVIFTSKIRNTTDLTVVLGSVVSPTVVIQNPTAIVSGLLANQWNFIVNNTAV
jgi:hypothetical protein